MIRGNKSISRQQTISSLLVIAILTIIAAGIVKTQFRFNPAVLHTDMLVPPDGKSEITFPPSSEQSFIPLPDGLTPLTPSEIFEVQNLSDKINGKAELYLSAGFSRLVSQRFKDQQESDLWLEAFVYDMANGQNAFSVFSAQRREDAVSLDITAHAYGTPNALFFVHGSYYVEIIASEASESAQRPMKLLAEGFIRNNRAEITTINEMELFPKQGLVADSVALISSDAFGYEGLDKVYTAEYELDGAVLMAYLSRRQSPDDAQTLSKAYHQFLMNFGGKAIQTPIQIKDAQAVEILDTYEIIFSHGAYTAGVREAVTIDQAKALVMQLFNRLQEVSGE